tara:strand:+ start:247 stop:522 length:276 start_codon:yes stop_codon:yes gene_type:complete
MEPDIVAETTSSFFTVLLEYGAMGLFCSYLVVSNWLQQKRLDRMLSRSENVASGIAEQLVQQNAKIDSIIETKKQDQLKRDLARMIEDRVE